MPFVGVAGFLNCPYNRRHMFHVTRCPNCHTSFRVTEAHLAAFEGKVRCGRCAFVFDARENFVGETPPPKPAPVVADAAPPSIPSPPPVEVAAPTAPVEAVPEIPATQPSAVDPEPPPPSETATDDKADGEYYGLDTISMQLDAAAEAEHDDEPESLASRSLQQLAAALGQVRDDADSLGNAPGEGEMLDLDLDLDGARGADEEMETIEISAVPHDDEDIHHFDLDTVTEAEPDILPPPLPIHVAHDSATDEIVVPPPITAYAGEEPISAYAESAVVEDDVEPYITAAETAPIPTGTYRPIMTAEDEKMLRVPVGPSPWRWLWSIPAFLALIALAGQLTYHYRTDISVELPGIKPRLERFCAMTGCKLELPARSEFLRTEWSEIKPVPDHANILQVDAVLRNQATFDQALPMMELTLTDDTDRIVAKKVFDARTYLAPLADGSPAPLPPNLPANGEAHIFLQLDLGTLHSSGYSINWLYPLHN